MTHEDRDYIQILRTNGYRVTPQRLIVLDAVCELEGHAKINDIVARVAYLDNTIDKSTIYRALDVLTEVGLVTETELGNEGKVYRVTGSSKHHHLVCQICDAVLTIDNASLAPVFEHLLTTYGFEVQADHLALSGICEQCRKKTDPDTSISDSS